MKPAELRKFTKKELLERLIKKQEELTAKQFEVRLGRDADTAELKEMRKEVARIMTILTEKSYVVSAEDEVEKEPVKVEEKKVKEVKTEKKEVKKEKVEKKAKKEVKKVKKETKKVVKKTTVKKPKKVTKTKKK